VAAQKHRISVITPSLNSGHKLTRAIESVLSQKCLAFEHIVIDAGSTDETLCILKSYPHLKWVSEPDMGQSDALNKGFAMSDGDIIVALNCDDYFAPNAFENVLPYFDAGAQFVVGNVIVNSFRLGRSFRNVARVGLNSMIRHWERNAYCYNPVGYFYTRKVQEAVPFNVKNNYTMDLEFLLAAAAKFPMIKIDKVLGYYDEGSSSKTTRSQADQDYWSVENFSYVEQHISTLRIGEQSLFRRDRQRGYARITRYWQRNAKIIQLREKIRAFGKMVFPW
jgi:glycosyltransferase involved in cell wall biosynthesis